jgi:twinkle protein
MPIEHDGSTFVSHEPCDACGSSDANSLFSDGHLWCFACETYTPAEGEQKPVTLNTPTSHAFLKGEPRAIAARGLSEEDCKKFGYWTGLDEHGHPVQIANYKDAKGNIIAQKIRGRDKSFRLIGDTKGLPLFASHLWSNGKKLCLLEGEIDSISLSKCFGHKFACVSLPNGAQSAVRAIKDNFDYINKFDEVIICTDMDEAGRNAAIAIAECLPVGKAKIANLPAKDANDALMRGKVDELIQSVYQAREFRPDGIRSAHDYRDIISVDETASAISWPYSMLNEKLMGIRKKELICLASGSGCGKTTFCKEVAYHLMMSGQKVGLISLEEAPKRTLLGLVGIHLEKNLLVDRSQATDQEVIDGFDALFNDRTCVLYDSFGVSSVETICQRIQYMARALDCDFIILDHVTMLTANMVDERRELDKCVTQFRTLVQELDIGMIMVSHLTRPSGRGHEDGAAVSLSQLRSSHSLAQLSDAAIGLQKDPDDPDSDIRMIRVLKNRFSGQIGDAGTLIYNRNTGRLSEFDLAFLTTSEDEEGEEQNERTNDITV